MITKLLILLLLLSVEVLLLPGVANAQYSIIVDDNFTRADTVVGTVTGPSTFNTPSTGATYVTTGTATWQIAADTLTGQAPGTTDGIEQCLRPASEDELNGKVAITFTLNTALASAYCATARYQSSGLAYEAYYFQNGSSAGNFDIAIFTGSGQTRLVSNTSLTLTNGASYIITLTCNGSNPTILGATIAAAAAPTAILATLTYSDSTSALQSTGQWGLTGATPAGTPTVFTHLTIYSTSTTPTIAVSPTSAIAGTNETITFAGSNLTTPWTTTAPVFTTSLGTLSAETVTSATTVTFTLAPGASAGTATFTDTSDTGSPAAAIIVNGATATAYTTTGPTSGTVSVASGNFTVTPNAAYTGTITPFASSGPTGVFSPTILTWSASSASQTYTFTPATTGTSAISTTSSPSITNTSGALSYAVNSVPLTMGTFAAVPSPAGIVLSVSSALSGGSGSGYSYHIFRATSLPLVVTGTPAFTVSSMPYTDTTVTSGTIYYYKLVGVDDAADVAYSAPAGETGVSTSAATGLTVAAEYSSTILNLVYMGDSITAGSTLSVPATQAPPVTCSIFLSGMYGIRNAFYTNEGYSGFTTNSFLPTVNTSNCYSNSVSAMADLEAANAGTEVFSIMLGTNDSAQSVTAAQVGTNLETIIGSLLASFPSAYVVMNEPILYTANQGNGYSETGLGFLSTYYTEYPIVAVYENGLHPGHVLVGETDAAGFFANSYTTEMTAQSGTNGYYFIHPDQQGALNLGRLWANGIYRAIFGEIISPSGRGRTLK